MRRKKVGIYKGDNGSQKEKKEGGGEGDEEEGEGRSW